MLKSKKDNMWSEKGTTTKLSVLMQWLSSIKTGIYKKYKNTDFIIKF